MIAIFACLLSKCVIVHDECTTIAEMALFEARRRWKGRPIDLAGVMPVVIKSAV